MKQDAFQIAVPLELESNAVAYTVEYIFGFRLGLNYSLTYEPLDAIQIRHKSSNALMKLGKPVFIISMSKMELDLKKMVEFNSQINCPKLFIDTNSSMGFDIFSAVFFFLSRYEEYLIADRDEHGRFLAKYSLQHNWGSLQMPIVDVWIQQLKNELILIFNFIQFNNESFECINTLDIDQAFAVQAKPYLKVLARMAKDFLTFNYGTLLRRTIGLFGGSDPFVLKPELMAQMEKPHVFYLMKNEVPFDKNIWLHSQYFEKQVQEMSAVAEIGIHPSYSSNGNPENMSIEKAQLELLVGPIIKSRQHYLKLDLPNTYTALLECGIDEDYSMGFSDQPGFRAGTSRPFYFFDLEKDQLTKLLITPFSLMDVSLKYYQKLNPDEAKATIEKLMNNLFSCKGMFVSLWHNESISGFDEWKGWDEVHENMLKIQKALLNEV